MALTVSDLFRESAKYQMKLLAGESGLGGCVQWVHMIESVEGARFLHGNELVITEGILESDEAKLLAFAETLYLQKASALIVNTGMFIQTIPDRVLAFCNEKGFPLFTIPWEIPLVDVTREYCRKIMDQSVREDSIGTVFKNLIFHIGDRETLIHQMERFGYLSGSMMQFLCFSLNVEKSTEEFINKSGKLKWLAESEAKAIRDRCISFEYQDKRIVVLVDYTENEVETYVDGIFEKLSANKLLSEVSIGVGDNVKGLECQEVNFTRAYAACKIAYKRRERILRYQELGLYQLLIPIDNMEILTDFYGDTFGKIIQYDRENGTEYYRFIKTYIECNGRQGEAGDRLFIHRNTVNNYIKKIEEITDLDLSSWEGRAKLYVALCIEDLL